MCVCLVVHSLSWNLGVLYVYVFFFALPQISTPDRKNNVERVLIENAAAGSYSVVISTYKLVKGVSVLH